MKLKTLKDFESLVDCKTCGREVILDVKELKAEAIKDYEAVKNKYLTMDLLSYIRWKNNLTGEDLK